MHRPVITILLLLAVPRLARSQPVDAGVADAPAPVDAAPLAQPTTQEPPQITFQQVPVYPDVPNAKRKITDVTVHVELDERGVVVDARVISPSNPPFDQGAIDTIKNTYVFEPPKSADGKPLPSHLDVVVHFDPLVQSNEKIEVHGDLAPAEAVKRPDLGASDRTIATEKVAQAIPHQEGAPGLLKDAGFFLANEGGEGHAEQIFLRGFDAREGQDIEIRVNGDVVNQAGNLHGNGYSDLHFVIPELVETVRVLEGPYDPRQGNFAVAGSADYELGLARRGLYASYDLGSFGTRRALLVWGPPGHDSHTFGGVEIASTDGFGQNRDARHATALGQAEGKLGDHGLWRLTSGAYIADYHSAGVIREDDYQLHQRDPNQGKGFFDTYDFGQGGAVSRGYLLAAIDQHHDDITYHHQLSLTAQTMNLREDFTGFLLDQQQPFQQPHSQRGDLLNLESDGVTAQASGFMRQHHDWRDHPQELELGYFGRVDQVSGRQYRIESSTTLGGAITGNGPPYHKDTDLDATLGDIGLYAAANLKLTDWLVFRGGARTDLLTYNVIDNCAVHDVAHPTSTNPPGDASCLSQQDFGKYREPVQRATASGTVVLPRATVLVGPFEHLTGSLSYGTGVRSIDPIYISNDITTPFASIASYDAGVTYVARPSDIDVHVALSGFRTHVDHDLVFSETVGRNILANGTTRTGAALSGQVSTCWLDEIGSATVVQSTFDDTHLLVPYVPDLVVRSDTIVHGELPWYDLGAFPLLGQAGLGVTYVGPRALPYGARSDRVITLDATAQVAWDRYTVGIKASNLLDTQYRLAEFNYASDFHTQSEPTLTIDRHFAAGAPRTVLLHLEVKL